MSLGVHVIVPRNEQNNDNSTIASPGTLGAFVPYAGGNGKDPTGASPVPNFYYAQSFDGGRASFGIGITAPFGLKTTSSDEWFGRYDAISASLRTINTSLVGAYRFDRFAIGGGIDIQYARTSLTSAIPNPFVPGGPTAATDGKISTTGHDWTPGFNIGVMIPLDDEGANRIGVHYRSGMKHKIKGTASIDNLTGPLSVFNGDVGATADLDLPAMVAIGVRGQVSPQLALFGEARWFDWSTFNEIRIRFDDGRPDGVRPAGYRDAYAVSFGAEYWVNDAWSLRGGIHYDSTPTVDQYRDTTVPDSERLWFGIGASYRLPKNSLAASSSLDFALTHTFLRDTRIDLTRTFFDDTPVFTAAQIRANVNSSSNTVSLQYRMAF